MDVMQILILFYPAYLQKTFTNLDSIGIAFAYTFLFICLFEIEYTISPNFFAG